MRRWKDGRPGSIWEVWDIRGKSAAEKGGISFTLIEKHTDSHRIRSFFPDPEPEKWRAFSVG